MRTKSRVARIAGTALVPGVSRNGRLYSREAIERATRRMAEQIGTVGGFPITMLTHHEAEDDSTRIVGKLTRVWLGDRGQMQYEADIADTPHGRTIATLAKHGYLNGGSIRGRWVGEPRTEELDGQTIETADDLEVIGLDWTKSPGVPGARVERVVMESVTADGGLVEVCDAASLLEADDLQDMQDRGEPARKAVGIDGTMGDAQDVPHDYQPDPDAPCIVCGLAGSARVHGGEADAPERPDDDEMETAAEAGPEDNGRTGPDGEPEDDSPDEQAEADREPYGDVEYADPGFQPDKKKRYPVNTADRVRAAWSYVNQRDNAAKYTAEQLAKVKAAIKRAAERFGIQISDDETAPAPEPEAAVGSPAETSSPTVGGATPEQEVDTMADEKATPTESTEAAPAFDPAAFAASIREAVTVGVAEGTKTGVAEGVKAALAAVQPAPAPDPAAEQPAPAAAETAETAPAALAVTETRPTATTAEQIAEALKDPEVLAQVKATLISEGAVPGRKATRTTSEGAAEDTRPLHELSRTELRGRLAESLPDEWMPGRPLTGFMVHKRTA